jgi:ABC-type dipeptide/oligopeptide/nickel transport system permease subunit
VLYGARLSLLVGLISQSVAVGLGVVLGLLAGYYGRWWTPGDAAGRHHLAFPPSCSSSRSPPRSNLRSRGFVVIGVVGWAGMARLVRSQVLVLKRAEFVLAAQALGALYRRVLLRHLLPNVRTQVIIAATLGIAGAIMA